MFETNETTFTPVRLIRTNMKYLKFKQWYAQRITVNKKVINLDSYMS